MQDVKFELNVNGDIVVVDLTDVDGLEWRAIRKETGLRPRQLFSAAQDLDLEAIAALLWVVKRRDQADLKFDQVLGSLNLGSFVVDDSEGNPDGEAEVDPFGSDGDAI